MKLISYIFLGWIFVCLNIIAQDSSEGSAVSPAEKNPIEEIKSEESPAETSTQASAETSKEPLKETTQEATSQEKVQEISDESLKEIPNELEAKNEQEIHAEKDKVQEEPVQEEPLKEQPKSIVEEKIDESKDENKNDEIVPLEEQTEQNTNSLSSKDSDDLEELKKDLSVDVDLYDKDLSDVNYKADKKNKVSSESNNGDDQGVFNDDEVGIEEKKLLGLAKFFKNKISEDEWHEIAASSKAEKYEVVSGDNLWNICKRLFGSGFYYSKIWSLNPYILNPHEIVPGMVLIFDLGDGNKMPQLRLGEFSDSSLEDNNEGGQKNDNNTSNDDLISKFKKDESSDLFIPPWLKEREDLKNKGLYFQYGNHKTYKDLLNSSEASLKKEYEKYDPPLLEAYTPKEKKDYKDGFWNKFTKFNVDFKKSLENHTFVTTNIIEDLGEIKYAQEEANNLYLNQMVYVSFHPSVKVHPGDIYSIYYPEGVLKYAKSDRKGYKYSVNGELSVVRKINHLWECQVTKIFNIINRGHRLTVHMPKIDDIPTTYNQQLVEAMVIGAYNPLVISYSYGDLVYLDRGRADGVEIGNVFELFSFTDRSNNRRITRDPTYKLGEVTVINLTDNFSTALVTYSSFEIPTGTLAITMDSQQAMIAAKNKKINKGKLKEIDESKLDDLEVELNLDNVNDDLLKKADSIHLSEGEMDELERREREKSFIEKGEEDLKSLERLEQELDSAQSQLNAAKVDEDKYLEGQNLNHLEKKAEIRAKEVFDEINEVEKEVGKKYMDEDLNSKENPYGLTEFDLEEVDELLNTTKQK